MTNFVFPAARRLWFKIHEPRVVSMLRFIMYSGFLVGGITTLHTPPSTIQGEMGDTAMFLLGCLLTFGSALGAIAVLPGAWWLERVAVVSVALSFSIYLWIILALHISTGGNRLLQAAAVFGVIISQAIRFARIWERPYDPDLRQQ